MIVFDRINNVVDGLRSCPDSCGAPYGEALSKVHCTVNGTKGDLVARQYGRFIEMGFQQSLVAVARRVCRTPSVT